MKDRYQIVLTPCPATRKESWGKVIASAPTVKALWDIAGWRGNIDHDQQIVMRDAKTGKEMSEVEYKELVERLMGWDKL